MVINELFIGVFMNEFYQWDVCGRVFMNGVFVNGFINVFISDSLIIKPPQAWEEHFRDPQSGVFLPFGCYLMKKELRFHSVLSQYFTLI